MPRALACSRNDRRLVDHSQSGFTLIELIMAMAVATIIMAAASYGILHTFNMNTRNTNYMTAVREAQSAGYWVTHDAAMARTVSWTANSLSLTWLDSSNITAPSHSCDYTLESGVLWRKLDSQPKTLVAQHINTDTTKTNFNYNPTARKLTFTVTATVTARKITGTETRTYEVSPRPGIQ